MPRQQAAMLAGAMLKKLIEIFVWRFMDLCMGLQHDLKALGKRTAAGLQKHLPAGCP